MKTKENLRLRRMGRKYMMVRLQESNVNLTEVYTLNQTAAELWQMVQDREFEPTELAEYLCRKYGIDRTLAQQDIDRMLEEWRNFSLLTE